MLGVYKVPALCRVNDGIQILHLLQDLFFIGVVNASGNIMEPMHALRTGAAICPAVKVKGVAGNAALGKTFQGRQVSLIVALCSVGIQNRGERSVTVRDQRLAVQAYPVVFHTKLLCAVAGLFLSDRRGKSHIVTNPYDGCNARQHGKGCRTDKQTPNPFFHQHTSKVRKITSSACRASGMAVNT